MKRAALYIRLSPLEQPLEAQAIELRELARRAGYNIAQEYTDHGVTGTKGRRPALDQMLKDAGRHNFDSVFVWSCDRLARSTKHFLQVLGELNQLGIRFVSQREAIDTEGSLGPAVVVIISAIADLERSLNRVHRYLLTQEYPDRPRSIADLIERRRTYDGGAVRPILLRGEDFCAKVAVRTVPVWLGFVGGVSPQQKIFPPDPQFGADYIMAGRIPPNQRKCKRYLGNVGAAGISLESSERKGEQHDMKTKTTTKQGTKEDDMQTSLLKPLANMIDKHRKALVKAAPLAARPHWAEREIRVMDDLQHLMSSLPEEEAFRLVIYRAKTDVYIGKFGRELARKGRRMLLAKRDDGTMTPSQDALFAKVYPRQLEGRVQI